MKHTKRARPLKPAFVATFASALGGVAAAGVFAFGCGVTEVNPPRVECPTAVPNVGDVCSVSETPALCTFNARCGGGARSFTCAAGKWAAAGSARAAPPECPSARPAEGSACLTGCGIDTCVYPATTPCNAPFGGRTTDTLICAKDVWTTKPVRSCNPPPPFDADAAVDADPIDAAHWMQAKTAN